MGCRLHPIMFRGASLARARDPSLPTPSPAQSTPHRVCAGKSDGWVWLVDRCTVDWPCSLEDGVGRGWEAVRGRRRDRYCWATSVKGGGGGGGHGRANNGLCARGAGGSSVHFLSVYFFSTLVKGA